MCNVCSASCGEIIKLLQNMVRDATQSFGTLQAAARRAGVDVASLFSGLASSLPLRLWVINKKSEVRLTAYAADENSSRS